MYFLKIYFVIFFNVLPVSGCRPTEVKNSNSPDLFFPYQSISVPSFLKKTVSQLGSIFLKCSIRSALYNFNPRCRTIASCGKPQKRHTTTSIYLKNTPAFPSRCFLDLNATFKINQLYFIRYLPRFPEEYKTLSI